MFTPETTPNTNTKLYVLMYHNFVPDGTDCNAWTLTESRFREDLQWLSEHGYTTIHPSELVSGASLPQKAVMITFDDGYLSNYEIAFPLLQEFQAKITISLVTSNVNQMFTWDMCREMAESGLVEFGSHTHKAHNAYSTGVARIPDETQDDYIARIIPDIQTSIELIENNLGKPVYLFAYPYGKTDEWIKAYMRETFSVTVTSEMKIGNIANGLYDLPRFNISMNTPLSMYLDK